MTEYRDSEGELLSTGDYIHNPHTEDIGQVDLKKHKLIYHDGTKFNLKVLGTKDWWHKISKDEYENRVVERIKDDKEAAEFKRLVKISLDNFRLTSLQDSDTISP